MKIHSIKFQQRHWYDSDSDGERGVLIAPHGKSLLPLNNAIDLGTRRCNALVVRTGLRNDSQRLESLEQTISEDLGCGKYVFVMFADSADFDWLRGQRWLE